MMEFLLLCYLVWCVFLIVLVAASVLFYVADCARRWFNRKYPIGGR